MVIVFFYRILAVVNNIQIYVILTLPAFSYLELNPWLCLGIFCNPLLHQWAGKPWCLHIVHVAYAGCLRGGVPALSPNIADMNAQ